MPFPASSGTWSAFYERNRNDNGAIQRLFRTNLTSLTVMTGNHLDNPVRLTETIAGSNYGNMLLMPGTTGFMQILHHGFVHAGELGGESVLLAVNGNLSEAALKVIPKEAAVTQVGNINRRRATAPECPSLDDFLGVRTAEEFNELEPTAGNGILRQKPNHLFIGPETFSMAKGARQIRSNQLAMLLIDKFRAEADDDDQANLARMDEAKEGELLLALLWASERDLLVPILLGEPEESTVLNQLHHEMKARLSGQTEGTIEVPDRGHGAGFMDDEGDEFPLENQFDGDESTTSSSRRPEATRTQDRFKELTMTTAGIVEIMKQVEAARQDERKSDAQEKSLLKHLGRSQRALFLALSTPELYIDPELSEFMVQLSKEKTATRALQLIQSEAREWEGSFSAGGFHRFLSTGFLSQEVNRGNPGGYTLFMFHTRTTDLGGPQFDAGKARLRDLFEAKVDEETILHYSKQGLFAAGNHHDMRVQLQTALDMLELLLGAGSIATQGLAYVLEPQRWRRMSVIFHDRFKSEPQFGAKFVYCLDRSLQQFFTQVERRNEEEVRPNYLREKAADLISMIDGGYEVTVRLPSALVPPSPNSTAVPLALPASTSAAGEPAKKKARKAGSPGPAGEPGSMVVQNMAPYPAWRLPDGKRYAEYFQGRDQSTKNWPVVPDDRLGARSPAPLCIRFQATAACRRNCRLAHVVRTALDTTVRGTVDARFVAAYAAVPTSLALVVT